MCNVIQVGKNVTESHGKETSICQTKNLVLFVKIYSIGETGSGKKPVFVDLKAVNGYLFFHEIQRDQWLRSPFHADKTEKPMFHRIPF